MLVGATATNQLEVVRQLLEAVPAVALRSDNSHAWAPTYLVRCTRMSKCLNLLLQAAPASAGDAVESNKHQSPLFQAPAFCAGWAAGVRLLLQAAPRRASVGCARPLAHPCCGTAGQRE